LCRFWYSVCLRETSWSLPMSVHRRTVMIITPASQAPRRKSTPEPKSTPWTCGECAKCLRDHGASHIVFWPSRTLRRISDRGVAGDPERVHMRPVPGRVLRLVVAGVNANFLFRPSSFEDSQHSALGHLLICCSFSHQGTAARQNLLSKNRAAHFNRLRTDMAQNNFDYEGSKLNGRLTV
jgi:hypothetical protein